MKFTDRRFLSYFRILKLVWEAKPSYMALAILLTVISAAALPAQIWLAKVIFDRLGEILQASSQAQVVDWYAFLIPIGAIFIVWAVGGTCQTLSTEVSMFVSLHFRNYAEFLVLKKATELDVAFFETPAFYDKMENALKNIPKAHNLAYSSLSFFGSLLSLGAVLALLLKLHPLAIVVLLLTSAPQAIVQAYYANRWYRIAFSSVPARRMATYLSSLLKSRDAVKEIRVFGLGKPFLRRFREFWQQYFAAEKRVRLSKERANALLGLASSAGTAGIWIYAVVQAIWRTITIGDVVLVFQAAERSRSMLGSFFRAIGRLYEDTLFAENLLSFLDLSPDSVEGALSRGNQSQIRVPRPIQQGIEFRNVSFHYPRSDRLVLKNLSFTLRPEETIAVVGENGAGKTTLVKLLARFYDPSEGVILLDGKDLREYDLEDLRHQIGVIFQDFIRYDLTVKENIGLGQIEHVDNMNRIVHASEQGGTKSLIADLPKGFDTVLGRTFEEGVDLSGGEWQRLALSRAFMRDAPILILDEPTAALDAFAEYEIYGRFAELTGGKMTIFISHRFSTVRMASHILVLQNGELIEEGSHDGLMREHGQYARMFNTQAERYR